MAEPLTFVDRNILTYAYDHTDTAKQAVVAGLLESLRESRTGVVSAQVLQEFYAVVTKKFRPPLPRTRARARVVSEDLQTGRRIAGLRIENPFAVRSD